MSKIALQGDASGTGTFTIASPNSNTDRTLTLPDEAGTVLTSASDIPAGNLTGDVIQNAGSAFRGYPSSSLGVSNNTWTKVPINTEDFDLSSDFDSSTNYRFTPQTEGYYLLNGNIFFDYTSTAPQYSIIGIYKNGSLASRAFMNLSSTTGYWGLNLTEIFYFNGSTDYVELYGYMNGGTGMQFYFRTDNTNFSGCLLRKA